jgi:ribosomal protein L40E
MAETLPCERCGGSNPTDARFCIDCGATLAPAATGPTTRLAGVQCPVCGAGNPEHARFCVVCGRGLNAGAVAPRPHAQPAIPPAPRTHSPSRHSYPQVAMPQAPLIGPPRQTHAPLRRWHSTHGGAPLFLIGLLFLLITHTIWPGILVLIGITSFLKASSQGRGHKATTALVWWGGLALLFATHLFWPGILVLIGINMVLGGRRGYGW